MDGLLGAHLAAEHLDGAIRTALVRVHVRLRAGTGLPHGEREMIVEFALDHFLRRAHDGGAELRIEMAQIHIGFSRGPFYDSQGTDNRNGLLLKTDSEIAE